MSSDNAKAEPPEMASMVSFVAPSGTGKTTLLSAVIAKLTERGHKVGAVKHDAHRIELDTEGKDSWRLRQAGASTLLIGRDQMAFFGSPQSGDGASEDERTVPALRDVVPLLFADVDLILVEGFRSEDLPTIMVSRSDHSDPSWEAPDPTRVFLTVSPDQVELVVETLEERYLFNTRRA